MWLTMLRAIDSVLDLKLTQWLLVLLTIGMTVASLLMMAKVKYYQIQNSNLINVNATCTVELQHQNEMVNRWGEEYARAKAEAENRQKLAQEIGKKTEEAVRGLLGTRFDGSCEQNIARAIGLAREIAR